MGKENGKPQWGQFKTLENGKWVYNNYSQKYLNFDGMTVNERLWVSGLSYEFEKAKSANKINATQILSALQVDKSSIEKIVK